MKTYFGEVPRKYEKEEIDRVNAEYQPEPDSSDCQVHAKVIRNKKLVVLRDQLRKLGENINKTVDQIDAILGCKGYHDVDEFYPK